MDGPKLIDAEQNARLSIWYGAPAEVWDYSVSHSILRVHMSQGPDSASVLIYMYGCRRVSFLSSWATSKTIVSLLPGEKEMFLVSDGDRLQVECESVYLSVPLASYTDIPKSVSGPPPGYPRTG